MVRIKQSENWTPRVKPVQANLTPITRPAWNNWNNNRYDTKLTDMDLLDIESIEIVWWTLITADTTVYTVDTTLLTADLVLLWGVQELTPITAVWWNQTNIVEKYWK